MKSPVSPTGAVALLSRCLACVTCLFAIAHGQIGIAPSQTGAFMEELRARHGHGRADVLGEDRANLEAGRPMLRSYLMRSGTFAGRLLEDSPFGTGQYQVGREYLNPWNEGLPTPARTARGIEGLEAGFVFEPMGFLEWDNASDDFHGAVAWLDVNARYALAEDQSFTLQSAVGLGERFSVGVLPGSTLAYDARFGDVAFTVYDTVSTLGGRFDDGFQRWQNAFGAAATWQVNPAWTVTLGYHDTVSEDPFSFIGTAQQRHTRSINGAAAVQVSEAWSGGVEAGYAWIDYDFGILDSAEHARIGLFAERVFPSLAAHLRVSAGYQHFDFDHGPVRAAGFPFPVFVIPFDRGHFDGPYFNLIFSQKLSRDVSHEVSLGYESTLNTFSNFITSGYANYGVTARLWQGGRLTTSAFLENIDSSSRVSGTDGFDFGGSLHLSQQLCPQVTAGLLLHYRRDGSGRFPSAVDSIDWDQYLFGTALDYAIKKDWTLKFGLSHRQVGGYNDTNFTTGLRIAF